MLLERINLEEDERVIAIIRKHWWVITVQTFFVCLFAILPAMSAQIILAVEPLNTLISYPAVVDFIALHSWEVIFLYTAWLLILWIALANFWTDHYLDLWAVTNKRVILVDQRGFFRRFISSFRLERLQDMNIEVNGVIATLLDYGTIEAQTAGGSNEEFTTDFMPKPRDIKALIVRAADDLNEHQRHTIDQLKEQGL